MLNHAPEDQEKRWEDDFIIPFSSDTFREDMIGITGVSDRDITYGDVKNITALLYNYPDGNGSELQYFTGLQELNCSNVGNLNVLSGMKELSVLAVTDQTDIRALADLTSLTELSLDSNELTDLSALANLPNLTFLSIQSVSLEDITPLASLDNLTQHTGLSLSCNSLTDIQALGTLPSLSYLSIKDCQAFVLGTLLTERPPSYIMKLLRRVKEIEKKSEKGVCAQQYLFVPQSDYD